MWNGTVNGASPCFTLFKKHADKFTLMNFFKFTFTLLQGVLSSLTVTMFRPHIYESVLGHPCTLSDSTLIETFGLLLLPVFVLLLLLTLLSSPAGVALTHKVEVKRFATRGVSEEVDFIRVRGHSWT